MQRQSLLQNYGDVTHHRSHNSTGLSSSQIEELRRIGVPEAKIQDVIDEYLDAQNNSNMYAGYKYSDVAQSDKLKRVYQGKSVSLNARLEAMSELSKSLRGQNILIAGQFPPRLLGELLGHGVALTQLDATDQYGFKPVHFYHLSRYGLRGITKVQDISDEFNVIIGHGAKANSKIYVSLIVSIILKLFPEAQRQILESDCRLPHMLAPIPAEGFKFIPHFLS